MTNMYVFRHLPSGVVCTIPADWSKVGNREHVLDEIEALASAKCGDKDTFSIIGCIAIDPYPEHWDTGNDSPSKLPEGWTYDIYVPSYKKAVSKIPELKAIPEKEIDRNEFKRQGLL